MTRYALHAQHAAAGARFATVCGWEVVQAYGDPTEEYRAVREGVGLVDRGDLGVVEVTGRDRAAFLHAILSHDVTGLSPGQGAGAALLDVHGKVQTLLTVLALEERILLLTPPAAGAAILGLLDRYLFSEKAVLRHATGELALLMLAGPRAPALAERLTGAAPPDAVWAHVAAAVDGIEVRLVRGAGETGEAEVWMLLAAAEGARLWDAARRAGARPVGLTARESLRLETGTPAFGHDVDASVLLPEIPFERFVSYTKGCYVGQEVVVRIRDRGHVNRHLCGLVLDGDAAPAPGASLLAGAAEVGRVTSATWSLGLKRPIALGFVRREHAAPGTTLGVRAGESTIPATVAPLPLPR